MGLARNSVLALGVVGYVVVLAGIVLQRMPIDTLIEEPPVLSIALATGIFVVYAVVVGWLFDQTK